MSLRQSLHSSHVMAEVSDDDVRRKLREVLKDTDLNTTTEKKLRKQLEEHFGCDLKPRKQIFKEEIESFLAQCDVFQQEEDDELEAEAAVDDAPKAKAKRKGRTTPQTFSEELCTFLNVSEAAEMSRADVVKRIWDYIKCESPHSCAFGSLLITELPARNHTEPKHARPRHALQQS